MKRPLPPFGREFVASGRRDPFVAIGAHAWTFARRRRHLRPTMVLPEGRDPFDFHWPVDGRPVVLIEIGSFDTARLQRTGLALLRAGAPLVTTIRESLLPSHTGPPWQVSPIFIKDDFYARRA